MEDAQVSRLDVRFKGNRSYLHGTDLFDAMVKVCLASTRQAPANIRMSFYRPVTHPVDAVRATVRVPVGERPAALFEARIDDGPVAWSIRERAGEEVPGRRPYDEEQVTSGAVVTGRSIAQADPTAYTFVERAVALNKRLLDRLPGNSGTNWWFARLELADLPARAPGLRLALETGLGNRLLKSSVEADGNRLGSIYFSEKRTG